MATIGVEERDHHIGNSAAYSLVWKSNDYGFTLPRTWTVPFCPDLSCNELLVIISDTARLLVRNNQVVIQPGHRIMHYWVAKYSYVRGFTLLTLHCLRVLYSRPVRVLRAHTVHAGMKLPVRRQDRSKTNCEITGTKHAWMDCCVEFIFVSWALLLTNEIRNRKWLEECILVCAPYSISITTSCILLQ